MWQCASCEYINDDWDESCLRCGVDRVTSEAEHALAEEQAAAAAAAAALLAKAEESRPVELRELERRILESAQQAEKEEPPAMQTEAAPALKPKVAQSSRSLQRETDKSADALLAAELAGNRLRGAEESTGRRRNDVAAILIIAICLLGICAVSYVAWSRGLIKLPESRAANQLDFARLGFIATPAYPQNAELQGLLASTVRNDRPLKPHAQLLFDCQAGFARILADLSESPLEQDAIRHELDITADLAGLLLEDYADFEERTITRNRRLDQESVSTLREQYAARAQQLMELLQTAYLQVDDISHPAFLYSDNIPEAFSKYGRIDASGYAAQWQGTREQRHQMELEIQYADVIDELRAWYSTLATLHGQVEKMIRDLGDISSNRGRLNPAGVKFVVLLDDYAFKIEDLNADFEDYARSLPDTGSSTVHDLVEQFRALAQEDHLYCFGGIYQRYAEDKYAELEQYDNLNAHYEYALQWWPKAKYDYEGVYTKYENRWKDLWKGP